MSEDQKPTEEKDEQKPDAAKPTGPNGAEPPGIKAQLVISFLEGGGVAVNGPIDNIILCYGLLEAAKDAIRRHVDQKNEGKIVVPKGSREFWTQKVRNILKN